MDAYTLIIKLDQDGNKIFVLISDNEGILGEEKRTKKIRRLNKKIDLLLYFKFNKII